MHQYISAAARPLTKQEIHCDCEYCGAKAGKKCEVANGENTGKPAGAPHHPRKMKFMRREYDVPVDYRPFTPPKEMPRPNAQLFVIDVIYERDGIAHEDFMEALEKLREYGAAIVTRHQELEDTVDQAFAVARSKARRNNVPERWT